MLSRGRFRDEKLAEDGYTVINIQYPTVNENIVEMTEKYIAPNIEEQVKKLEKVNLETDIKLGYDAKIETIMVCSGVHTEKDIERLKVYPTRVVKNLRELID